MSPRELFLAVLFSFLVGSIDKIYYARRKYSLRNLHTHHPKISSDRQGGELVRVKFSRSEHKLVFATTLAMKVIFGTETNY